MSISPGGVYFVPVNPVRAVYSQLTFSSAGVLLMGGGNATWKAGPGAGSTDWLLLYNSVASWFLCPTSPMTLEIKLSHDGTNYRHWRFYPIHVVGVADVACNGVSGVYIPAWSCQFVLHAENPAGGPYEVAGVIKVQAVT